MVTLVLTKCWIQPSTKAVFSWALEGCKEIGHRIKWTSWFFSLSSSLELFPKTHCPSTSSKADSSLKSRPGGKGAPYFVSVKSKRLTLIKIRAYRFPQTILQKMFQATVCLPCSILGTSKCPQRERLAEATPEPPLTFTHLQKFSQNLFLVKR